ncbi:MAG: hypothetical protein HY952_01885 [Elusimicrobia bacterium]|nr:hypothetical protein [Elusimicrobiota bacterium]
MKTEIAAVTLLTVTAAVFAYTRPHKAAPSDLRDAVADKSAISQLGGDQNAPMSQPRPADPAAGAPATLPVLAKDTGVIPVSKPVAVEKRFNKSGNCAGRLAAIHTGWDPGNLRAACDGAEADCVVNTARVHTGWGPENLMAACAGGDNGGYDYGHHGNCAGLLSAIHASWPPGDLEAACTGAAAECVVNVARRHNGWAVADLHAACAGDDHNCAGRLALRRPTWGPEKLKEACNGADANCVDSTAYWSDQFMTPGLLNKECTRGN